jgi:hypothetical protein
MGVAEVPYSRESCFVLLETVHGMLKRLYFPFPALHLKTDIY